MLFVFGFFKFSFFGERGVVILHASLFKYDSKHNVITILVDKKVTGTL